MGYRCRSKGRIPLRIKALPDNAKIDMTDSADLVISKEKILSTTFTNSSHGKRYKPQCDIRLNRTVFIHPGRFPAVLFHCIS